MSLRRKGEDIEMRERERGEDDDDDDDSDDRVKVRGTRTAPHSGPDSRLTKIDKQMGAGA